MSASHIATAREALAAGEARKLGEVIYADRGPDGLTESTSGRRLSEIIPAGYSWHDTTTHGPVRIIQYRHHANASAPVWVVAR